MATNPGILVSDLLSRDGPHESGYPKWREDFGYWMLNDMDTPEWRAWIERVKVSQSADIRWS